VWIEKNGKTFRIRDEVGGKRVTVASGLQTKTAAKARRAQLVADASRGDSLVPRGGRIRLAAWIDAWWPTYEISLKPTTQLSEGSRVRNHIRPLLGQYELDELDALTIQTWVAQMLAGEKDPERPGKWLRRPLAPKTVRNVHGILHKIVGGAVSQRLIRANPCTASHLPKVPHKEMRFLAEPDIGRLIAAVPPHWRPLVLLLVSTGLRWGEATGLQVKHVDVLAGRLTVLRSMHELPGSGEIVFGEPKTERGRRTVAFDPRRVGTALAGLVAGEGREELVFHAPRGGVVRTRNFRRGWVKWVSAAGLDGLRIHDLRHTCAAILISAGVPLTGVQRMLGHSSIAVTSDLYGHLLPAVDEGILVAISAALSAVDPELLAAEIEAELEPVA
jgi:integrase